MSIELHPWAGPGAGEVERREGGRRGAPAAGGEAANRGRRGRCGRGRGGRAAPLAGAATLRLDVLQTWKDNTG